MVALLVAIVCVWVFLYGIIFIVCGLRDRHRACVEDTTQLLVTGLAWVGASLFTGFTLFM